MGVVLVTGGAGSLGRFVVDELQELGLEPVVVDLQAAERMDAGGVQAISCDIRDAAALDDLVARSGAEGIIHLAAVLFQCEQDVRLGYEVNIGGVVSVLEAARAHPTVGRVVYTSAKTVYGEMAGDFAHPHYRAVPEARPPSPDSIYGITKLAGEHFGVAYARKGDLEFVALRLATLYGPGRLERHGPVAGISGMVEAAVKGSRTEFPQGGDQGDDILYTRDAARAICAAYVAPSSRLPPAAQDRVFNIGSGAVVTLREVADAVRSLVPGAQIEVGSGLDYMGTPRRYYMRLDCARAAQYLGFTPTFGQHEGLADYISLVE